MKFGHPLPKIVKWPLVMLNLVNSPVNSTQASNSVLLITENIGTGSHMITSGISQLKLWNNGILQGFIERNWVMTISTKYNYKWAFSTSLFVLSIFLCHLLREMATCPIWFPMADVLSFGMLVNVSLSWVSRLCLYIFSCKCRQSSIGPERNWVH